VRGVSDVSTGDMSTRDDKRNEPKETVKGQSETSLEEEIGDQEAEQT
jgi:hypothetical protein